MAVPTKLAGSLFLYLDRVKMFTHLEGISNSLGGTPHWALEPGEVKLKGQISKLKC